MKFIFTCTGAGYNANYGNPESGYPGNYYPASYGMNPAHAVSNSLLVLTFNEIMKGAEGQHYSPLAHLDEI